PEAQLDRFLLKVSMGYPSKSDEVSIINRFIKNNPLESIEPVCTVAEAVAMKSEVKEVFVHEAIMNYIVDIVNKTRNHDNVSIGVSTRGTLNMVNAARAYAYIQGRTFVTPEDIKKLAVPVFAHRVVLKHGMTREDNRGLIIEGILGEVEVPTEDWDR
ncbi:MAG: MoxR family ATPase, partial [Lachnospira sp.]|nr:MoxR family ATPase [Lachnospira sp.]